MSTNQKRVFTCSHNSLEEVQHGRERGALQQWRLRQLEHLRQHCLVDDGDDSLVGGGDAGDQCECELSNVEVRLGDEGRQLSQHWRQRVHTEAGTVVPGESVQQLETGKLESSLILPEEGGQDWETLHQDTAQIYPQR